MSTLTDKLNAALTYAGEQRLQSWRQGGATSGNLVEAVAEVRRQVGNCNLATDDPRLVDAAIARLIARGPESLRTRDDIHLAANLTSLQPRLEQQSLCDRSKLLFSLLGRWDQEIATSSLGDLIWLGVFQNYFRIDDEQLLNAIRTFLRTGLRSLKRTEFTSPQLKVVERHPGLLDDRPAEHFARQWLNGDDDALQQLRQVVEIPDQSWFWDAYLSEILDCVCNLSDVPFGSQLDRALHLAHSGTRHRDRVLGRLVNRLAESSRRGVHGGLLQALLDAWGSPQLNLGDRAHRWSQASNAARLMICQWVAEDDLKDFFELIKSSRAMESMDERRFTFWSRYTDQMMFTKLILAQNFHLSSNPDVQRFVKKRRDRLGWLNGTNSYNVAIVMKLRDWWFVEFSQTGNACFGYHDNVRPFELDSSGYIPNDFRKKVTSRLRLLHNGPWEQRFTEALQQCAIRLDVGVARTPQTTPSSQFPEVAANCAVHSLRLPEDYATELARIRCRVVDHTAGGGRLWIETSADPSPMLQIAMEAAGFRFAKSRGFYR